MIKDFFNELKIISINVVVLFIATSILLLLVCVFCTLKGWADSELYLNAQTGQPVLGKWEKSGETFFNYDTGKLQFGEQDENLIYDDANTLPTILVPLDRE